MDFYIDDDDDDYDDDILNQIIINYVLKVDDNKLWRLSDVITISSLGDNNHMTLMNSVHCTYTVHAE